MVGRQSAIGSRQWRASEAGGRITKTLDRGRDDTAQRKRIRACNLHMRDLRRVYRRPPADVALPRVAIPERLSGEPVSSGCGSPAQMCVELFSGAAPMGRLLR
jgi:hypothetical protein